MDLNSSIDMQKFTLVTGINDLIMPFHIGKVWLMNGHLRSQPKGRVPHRSRELLPWTPHHVVLTVRHDVPPLHRRTIRNLFAVAISKTIEKYTDVSFNLGCMMSDHVHLLAQPKGDQTRISVAVQYLSAQLARLINRAYGRKVQVFRDRFFSRVLRTVSDHEASTSNPQLRGTKCRTALSSWVLLLTIRVHSHGVTAENAIDLSPHPHR